MGSPLDRGTRGDNPLGMSVLSAVPLDPRSSGLSYEPFYGLKEQPFSLSPDPRFFYRSRLHAAAFEDLRIAIERRECVAVVTGDIGSGKTVLCRALAADLDDRAVVALIPDPAISRETFLRSLIVEFGAAPGDDPSDPLHGLSAAELRHHVRARLLTLSTRNTIALVVIDEAQRISAEVVDEVNVLTEHDDPLQVILVGQLDLADRLAAPEMRRLDQRASVRCTLMPLDRASVVGYISYRLHKVGGSPDRIRFSDAAIDAVYERSGGVPRIVNRLCDRALAAAHGQRVSEVGRDLVPTIEGGIHAIPPSPVPRAAVAPPPAVAADPVESWIARIDDRAGQLAVAAGIESPAELPESEPEPIAYAPARRGGGVVLRIRVSRRARNRRHRRLQRRSDRWARRLANLLLALTLLLACAMGGELLSFW